MTFPHWRFHKDKQIMQIIDKILSLVQNSVFYKEELILRHTTKTAHSSGPRPYNPVKRFKLRNGTTILENYSISDLLIKCTIEKTTRFLIQDKELYVFNDAGYLLKYRTAEPASPFLQGFAFTLNANTYLIDLNLNLIYEETQLYMTSDGMLYADPNTINPDISDVLTTDAYIGLKQVEPSELTSQQTLQISLFESAATWDDPWEGEWLLDEKGKPTLDSNGRIQVNPKKKKLAKYSGLTNDYHRYLYVYHDITPDMYYDVIPYNGIIVTYDDTFGLKQAYNAQLNIVNSFVKDAFYNEQYYFPIIRMLTIWRTVVNMVADQTTNTAFNYALADSNTIDRFLSLYQMDMFKTLEMPLKKRLMENIHYLIRHRGTFECIEHVLKIFDFTCDIQRYDLIKTYPHKSSAFLFNQTKNDLTWEIRIAGQKYMAERQETAKETLELLLQKLPEKIVYRKQPDKDGLRIHFFSAGLEVAVDEYDINSNRPAPLPRLPQSFVDFDAAKLAFLSKDRNGKVVSDNIDYHSIVSSDETWKATEAEILEKDFSNVNSKYIRIFATYRSNQELVLSFMLSSLIGMNPTNFTVQFNGHSTPLIALVIAYYHEALNLPIPRHAGKTIGIANPYNLVPAELEKYADFIRNNLQDYNRLQQLMADCTQYHQYTALSAEFAKKFTVSLDTSKFDNYSSYGEFLKLFPHVYEFVTTTESKNIRRLLIATFKRILPTLEFDSDANATDTGSIKRMIEMFKPFFTHILDIDNIKIRPDRIQYYAKVLDSLIHVDMLTIKSDFVLTQAYAAELSTLIGKFIDGQIPQETLVGLLDIFYARNLFTVDVVSKRVKQIMRGTDTYELKNLLPKLMIREVFLDKLVNLPYINVTETRPSLDEVLIIDRLVAQNDDLCIFFKDKMITVGENVVTASAIPIADSLQINSRTIIQESLQVKERLNL